MNINSEASLATTVSWAAPYGRQGSAQDDMPAKEERSSKDQKEVRKEKTSVEENDVPAEKVGAEKAGTEEKAAERPGSEEIFTKEERISKDLTGAPKENVTGDKKGVRERNGASGEHMCVDDSPYSPYSPYSDDDTTRAEHPLVTQAGALQSKFIDIHVEKVDNTLVRRSACKIIVTSLMSTVWTMCVIFHLIVIVSLALFFGVLVLMFVRNDEAKQICLSKKCVETSARILSKMNLSVDPCEDMYQYACGNYIANTYLSPEESIKGTFSDLSSKIHKAMHKLLSSNPTELKGQYSSAIAKLRTFYRSCMDVGRVRAQNTARLFQIMNELGSWNVTRHGLDKWNRQSWSLDDVILRLHKMGLNAFFETSVVRNGLFAVIEFRPPSFIRGSAKYKRSDVMEAVVNASQTVVRLLAGNEELDMRKLIDIYRFESKLFQLLNHQGASDHNTEDDVVKSVDLTEFQHNMGYWIDVEKYLKDLLNIEHLSAKPNVRCFSVAYFQALNTLLEETDQETLANYLMWYLISAHTDYLPDIYSKQFVQVMRLTRGATRLDSRMEMCLEKVKDFFPSPVNTLFIQEKYKAFTAEQILHTFYKVKMEFISNLEGLEWLDDTTKTKLLDKATEVTLDMGFSSMPLYPSRLDEIYDKLHVSDGEFFFNALNASIYKRKKHFELYVKSPYRDELSYQDAAEVKVSYDYSINKMLLSAGLVQPPVYDPDLPISMNYAAFGTIVGHLLTEAFGGDNGYLAKAESWTNDSREMFDRLSQCMVDQYNAYQIDGHNVNGTLTLMHNIAYNGGVRVAYEAYKTDTNFKDLEMPGLNLTNQQIFFLGYSQLWCAKERMESPKNYLSMDFHGSNMYRVIGTLSNNVEFSKVFHCVRNKPMNPKIKCQVW